jgi:hypothetical protein
MPNINLKGLTRSGSPAPAILTFMGMTGGAYYLYKQKGVDSNSDSTVETKVTTLVETAKKDLPAETDTKLQDLVKSKMPGFAQDDQKDLTKPTATKDSSEK